MIKRFFNNQSGAVFSIEFAVIAPLFMLFIFAIIELCRLLFIASVLDVITVEGAYFTAKSEVEMRNYSKLFYDKVSEEVPLWPLLTSDSALEINIMYCSSINDAVNYLTTSGGHCSSSPMHRALAIFSVKYHYSPLVSPSALTSLNDILERQVVVFKEY